MDERLITSTMQFDDTEVENVLRPKSMSSFVGQDKIKNNLEKHPQNGLPSAGIFLRLRSGVIVNF